jgi:hypothetical protein
MRKIALHDVDIINVRASFDAFIASLRVRSHVIVNDDVHASFTRFYDSIVHDRDDVEYVRVARADVTIDDVTHHVHARINVRTGRIENAHWYVESYQRYDA